MLLIKGPLHVVRRALTRLYLLDVEMSAKVEKLPDIAARSVRGSAEVFDASGTLYVYEAKQRQIFRRANKGPHRPFGEQIPGDVASGKNELILDAAGGLYLLEAHGEPEEGKIYYITRKGKVPEQLAVVEKLSGMALTVDGKLLLVGYPLRREVRAHVVKAGRVGESWVYYRAEPFRGKGPHALVRTEDGRIYAGFDDVLVLGLALRPDYLARRGRSLDPIEKMERSVISLVRVPGSVRTLSFAGPGLRKVHIATSKGRYAWTTGSCGAPPREAWDVDHSKLSTQRLLRAFYRGDAFDKRSLWRALGMRGPAARNALDGLVLLLHVAAFGKEKSGDIAGKGALVGREAAKDLAEAIARIANTGPAAGQALGYLTASASEEEVWRRSSARLRKLGPVVEAALPYLTPALTKPKTKPGQLCAVLDCVAEGGLMATSHLHAIDKLRESDNTLLAKHAQAAYAKLLPVRIAYLEGMAKSPHEAIANSAKRELRKLRK